MMDGIGVAIIIGCIGVGVAVVAQAGEDKPIAYELPSVGFANGAVVVEFKSKLDPRVTCFYIPQDKLLRCVRPAS